MSTAPVCLPVILSLFPALISKSLDEIICIIPVELFVHCIMPLPLVALYILKSVPKIRVSSAPAFALSPNSILEPLVSNTPPSCGLVSSTILASPPTSAPSNCSFPALTPSVYSVSPLSTNFKLLSLKNK